MLWNDQGEFYPPTTLFYQTLHPRKRTINTPPAFENHPNTLVLTLPSATLIHLPSQPFCIITILTLFCMTEYGRD